MPNYKASPVPTDVKEIAGYLTRELPRIGNNLADAADSVFYRTLPANQGSLSNGISANWKLAEGNVIRISTSNTHTLTGIALKTANREIVLLNVGTGVLSLKSAGTESSASYRFLLPTNYQISANHAITIWNDPYSSRWRALSRT